MKPYKLKTNTTNCRTIPAYQLDTQKVKKHIMCVICRLSIDFFYYTRADVYICSYCYHAMKRKSNLEKRRNKNEICKICKSVNLPQGLMIYEVKMGKVNCKNCKNR